MFRANTLSLLLFVWFEIHDCSCCANHSFHWPSISETKFLPLLTAEAGNPVLCQKFRQPASPAWAAAASPQWRNEGRHLLTEIKCTKEYNDLFGGWCYLTSLSRRLNIDTGALKEKHYCSVWYLRTSWPTLPYCRWKLYWKEWGFLKPTAVQASAASLNLGEGAVSIIPPFQHMPTHGTSVAFLSILQAHGTSSSSATPGAASCHWAPSGAGEREAKCLGGASGAWRGRTAAGCLTFPLHTPPKARCPQWAGLDWNPAWHPQGAVSWVSVDRECWESAYLWCKRVFLKKQQIMQFHTWLSWKVGNVLFWTSTVSEPKARGQLSVRPRVSCSLLRVQPMLPGLAVLQDTLRHLSPCNVSSFVVISTSGEKERS